MNDYFLVGIISSTHGIRGELKVFPTTDDPMRYKKLKEVVLDTGREKLTLHITSARMSKNMVIVKFKEFDNINDVERFKGKQLYVSRENAVRLDKDEYFIADLIGIKCISDLGENLGKITDVIQTGANDVYQIEDENGNELLVPAIKDCIINVDMEEYVMTIHVLEGLR